MHHKDDDKTMTSVTSSSATESSFTDGSSSYTGTSYTGTSYNSSSLFPSQYSENDRMLHDESSDASSSYYFLQQFGSFATQEEEEEEQRKLAQSTDWNYGDPKDVVLENSSSSSSSSSSSHDSERNKDASSHESISRIGIQPLGTYSFDTIMEDDESKKTDDNTSLPRQPSLTKSRTITSQDAYWNSTNNQSNSFQTKDDEYSFFSEGISEERHTLWELLRLQTVLGSCTQPQNDSFDEGTIPENDIIQEKGAADKQPTSKAKEQPTPPPKKSDGWVFFQQMTQCGFPEEQDQPPTRTRSATATTTATTTEKKQESSHTISKSPSPKKSDLSQYLVSEVYYNNDSDPEDMETKQQDIVMETIRQTKSRFKSFLGKLKRTTSADAVKSVQLAASFTEDGASIIFGGAASKYEKLEEPEQEKERKEKVEAKQEAKGEEKKEDPEQEDLPSDEFKAKESSKPQQPPVEPEQESMFLCTFTDHFGCYDPQPQHDIFDDFGVDASNTRNNNNKRSSWAHFDRVFPQATKTNKTAPLNTSYTSTETATTADETVVMADTSPIIEDSEYGSEATSYLLYQQKQRKSQHRLSKGLKKMKRRFSKTKAEI